MSNYSKVIWKEGMFLQPQHFQQTEKYLFNTINTRIAACQPFYNGITQLEIDKDALVNELFTLKNCSGVLYDGTVFSIPVDNSAPKSRSFTDHFSHDQQKLNVFLALPLMVDGKGSYGGIGADQYSVCRYTSKTSKVTDEVFGTQKKDIELGEFNFQILFEDESLDSYSSVQIARLKRTSSGLIELDEEYIPPVLQINASRYLMGRIRSLLELLMAKCSSLSQGRRQIEGGFAEFSSSEETAFRLLQTLNTYTPLLNYQYNSGISHPFQLYTDLSMLAGALSSFSAQVSLKDFPMYEHHNLTATLIRLEHIIRTVLEADISAGCVNVPVDQVNSATFVCKVPDERLLSSAKFYLGVSARVPEKELIVGVLQRIKMCSRDRIELLISSAMPGLPLMHVSRPPETLSTKPGFIYFSLDQKNQFWNGIQSSGSIAFYFPNNYPELKLEMLALKE